ncbi:DMT family transporter [Streptomyces humi]|uniref:DMT family transporter n=1 Tax=Streptomyces humi TaxID=1428620 RepID=UPI0009A0CC29|nr:EamA family transporter [Streptomyces humi]
MPNDTSFPSSSSGLAAAAAPRPRRTGPLAGPVPILTAAVLWGTTGTASSLAPAGAPAAAVGAAGLVLGGLLLFLTAPGARTLPRTCTGGERRLLALGVLAVAGYPLTFYPAVARTGVAAATVIALGGAPVLAGLLGLLTGRSRPTGRWAAATTAAVLGCAVLVLGPELTGDGAPVDVPGVLLAGLAGLSYAGYALVGGELIARGHRSDTVMGVLFGGAALLVLPVVLWNAGSWLPSVRGALVVVYLGAVTTFLCYRLFGHGLRRTAAQIATTLTLAEPAVAAVLGVASLGERLPAASWCGLGVLALGIVLLAVPVPSRFRGRVG